MVTVENKMRILSVLNIIESGTPDGNYADVSIYADGKEDKNGNPTRQVTYGVRQTTEQGNLKELLQLYAVKGGIFAGDFAPYMSKLKVVPLADDKVFIELLKQAAKEDAIMREAQDEFFDKAYYQPANQFFISNKFQLPLSMLVIYDSYIHSGRIPDFLRTRFPEAPPVRGGDEKAWTRAYVTVRHNWLSTHKSAPLRVSSYRTKGFLQQISLENWHLDEKVMMNGSLSRDMLENQETFDWKDMGF
jgi:chitosanase